MMQFFMRYLTILREGQQDLNAKGSKQTDSDRLRGSSRNSRISHEDSEFEGWHHKGHGPSQRDNVEREIRHRDPDAVRDSRVVKHGRGVRDDSEDRRRDERGSARGGRYNGRHVDSDADVGYSDELSDEDIPNHRDYVRDRRDLNELHDLRDNHRENRRKHKGEKDDGRRGR